MTIEQRPELNRYVDPDFIAPWETRWRRIKLILPLWLFSLAWFAELMLLMAWSANRPLPVAVAIAIGMSLAPFLFIWVLMEVGILLGRRTKRVIQFEDDKIILSPSARVPVLIWSDVLKFQFEPVPALPGMTKFALHYSKLWKNRPRMKRIMMVIENPVQVRELLDYLQKRKSAGSNNFEIAVLNAPSPLFEPQPHAVLGLTMTLAGMFLFMHGLMFVFGVIGHGHSDGDGNSKFSPQQIARIQAFWHQHFQTYSEFRNFSLSLGISLIFIGGGLCILSKRLDKNKSQPSAHS